MSNQNVNLNDDLNEAKKRLFRDTEKNSVAGKELLLWGIPFALILIIEFVSFASLAFQDEEERGQAFFALGSIVVTSILALHQAKEYGIKEEKRKYIQAYEDFIQRNTNNEKEK
ncbi:MAG: hypothetical protein ACFCUV_10825 [Rivularia sp. (in: cyanobacteria)]